MRWSAPARQVEPPRIANLTGDRHAGWRWRMRIRCCLRLRAAHNT
ncbi:hypothetical protein XOC_0224 [Xanthomonas oryzae pv. oryzicola BLS256]|uniref:Uncharacterized protein n=1 Tax=Xanthomonas oryzae pv. oryzicola (strain BLS256) TaxID=383407 RepID=G7TJR9_XANOB|nr:hypothetical protein XOC_0224 [Xanthomonas oryzae pv. oryzicola BLS256]